MSDSILISTKEALGMEEDYEYFDNDLIMHINSVFSILAQIGVGPEDGFEITGTDEVWEDFTENVKLLNLVKTYMVMKVRYIFDPPTSSSVMEAVKQTAAELEWRAYIACDPITE